ncbi:MAG: hypothetical protein QM779_17790 [Propionicimonas sp.]|uniref:hypothetical protein n=1 Tax=Propionicimonas sp. TaxID=1955623 RepID=UPI003D0DF7A0
MKRSAGLVALAVTLACTACGAATESPVPTPVRDASPILDVNCDGVADAVSGTPTADSPDGTRPATPGAVHVQFGGTGRVQTVTQDELGDPAPLFSGRFAGVGGVIAGDLDADGCTDVVVSDPAAGGGRVWALWGSPRGLAPDAASLLIVGSGSEQLGGVLAFVPRPDPVLVVSEESTRRVLRLYPLGADGSPGAPELLDVSSPVDRSAWNTDTFAWRLAADDDLLVIGSPEYSDEGAGYPGEVFVVRFTTGFAHGVLRLAQDAPGVPGRHRLGDGFGDAVAISGDRLAIGVRDRAGADTTQLYDVGPGETPSVTWVETRSGTP